MSKSVCAASGGWEIILREKLRRGIIVLGSHNPDMAVRISQLLCLCFCFLVLPYPAYGKPLIYQATGSRPEDIRPVVEQFKRDVLFGLGNSALPPGWQPGTFREATFDDLAAGATNTIGSWVPIVSGGLLFGEAPGSGFLVSAGATNTPTGNLLFGDINSAYPALFQPYSPPSVLAVRGGIRDGGYSVGTFPAGMNAFGAVFSDVDFERTTRFEDFLQVPLASFAFDVPPFSGEANLTFLGVIFDEGETLNLLAVRSTPLIEQRGPFSESVFQDFVAVDNVILGRVAVPEPNVRVLIFLGLTIALGVLRRSRRL